MPSEVVLESKKQQVAAIKARIDASVTGIIVDYNGINVADDTKLRKELREAGVHYSVVKNTLLNIAIEGTDLSDLGGVLNGTTALATSDSDYVAAARILVKFAEGHDSFSIKGGFLDGEIISLDKIDALAKLPSREVLLSMVCNVLQAPIAAFARVIKAVADKDGEAAPAEEASAE